MQGTGINVTFIGTAKDKKGRLFNSRGYGTGNGGVTKVNGKCKVIITKSSSSGDENYAVRNGRLAVAKRRKGDVSNTVRTSCAENLVVGSGALLRSCTGNVRLCARGRRFAVSKGGMRSIRSGICGIPSTVTFHSNGGSNAVTKGALLEGGRGLGTCISLEKVGVSARREVRLIVNGGDGGFILPMTKKTKERMGCLLGWGLPRK